MNYSLDPVGNRLSELSNLSGVPSGGWSFDPDDRASGESHDQNGNTTAIQWKDICPLACDFADLAD